MFSYIIAASLILSAPLLAECNCSPEKIEALRAKLRAEGASEDKVKDVNCEDVCEAEKPLACDSPECSDNKEETQLAHEDGEEQGSSHEDTLLAGCNCGKKSKGNG